MIGEYTYHIDETDETIIDIAFNGKDIAWFLSDDITDQQVKNIVDRLNEYVKKCNRLEDDLQYYKTKSASLETGYLDLQNENEKLKRIITKLEMERCEYLNDQQAKNKWGEKL